jgi:S-adenosylmethionine synthetase
MEIKIIRSSVLSVPKDFEVIERKGKGHPDTLADGLAEYLSVNYSKYTKKKFGAILHHNFDKIGLLGGASSVSFGKGRLTKPIRVILNGRASTKFGNKNIPISKLLVDWTKEYFNDRLHGVNPKKDLRFILELSNQSSPGKTHSDKIIKNASRRFWFEPRGIKDLPEFENLFSNDTSLGVGYAPLSKAERFVLELEKFLSGRQTRQKYPWLGTDIKIMCKRIKKDVSVTMCIPQIADFVNSVEVYKENLWTCRKIVNQLAKKRGINLVELSINTRDNFNVYELYLTATGTSLESGDEGLVGRGNRINGLISPTNPYSMEGSCGKNPVYHIGKIYYLQAQLIANEIYEKYKINNQVFLGSQSGRKLKDPWINVIILPESTSKAKEKEIEKIARNKIEKIDRLTKQITDEQFEFS